MRSAVVIGAGGAGRETAAWYHAAVPNALVVGYLDEDRQTHGEQRGALSVLGDLTWLDRHEVDDVVIGVGSPAARRQVMAALSGRDVRPSTVVHPSATLGERVQVGEGTVIAPGVIITVDVAIGRCAYLNYGAAVGHDSIIGDFAVLAPRSTIAGNVRVCDGVELGIGASSIQGLTVGEGAVIGGGACITRDVPERVVAVGVPARPIKAHDRW